MEHNGNQPLMEKPFWEHEELPSQVQPPLPLAMAKSFILYAVFTGVFFTVCFVGTGKSPALSLLVFSIVTMALTAVLFFYNKLVENPKGFLYGIPILIFSLENAVFRFSLLSVLNTLMVFIFFSCMVYAVRGYCIVADIKQFFSGLAAITFPSFDPLGPILKSIQPKKEFGRPPFYKKVFIGLALALPILILCTALLSSADLMFRYFFLKLQDLFHFFSLPGIVRNFWKWIAAACVSFYTMAYLCHSVKLSSHAINGKKLHLDNVIWITFLLAINLLFAVFCLIQFLYLFHGGFMALPANFTYASYARKGFFELLFVTCINFTIVISFISVMKQDASKKVIRGLLFLLCIFTSILVYSSFYRMSLYIAANGYTILRVQVLTFLWMESLLLLVTVIYLIKGRFHLFPWYLLILSVFIATVNVTGSEYNVTRLNIRHYQKTGEINVAYFQLVSAESIGQLYAFYHQELELREQLKPYLFYPQLNFNAPWQSKTFLQEISAGQALAYRSVYPNIYPDIFP